LKINNTKQKIILKESPIVFIIHKYKNSEKTCQFHQGYYNINKQSKREVNFKKFWPIALKKLDETKTMIKNIVVWKLLNEWFDEWMLHIITEKFWRQCSKHTIYSYYM